MVKHSPNERLRLLQQQQQQQRTMDGATPALDGPPALEDPARVQPAGTGVPPPNLGAQGGTQPLDPNAAEFPPVDEVLRRAAEVRAEAEAQEERATGFTPHPNVNTRRRRAQDADDIHLDDDFRGADSDDLGGSFAGDFPDAPPPWLSQVINAAVSAAATAVAALPHRQAQGSRPSLAPTKLSDRKVPDFWESKPEEWFRIFDAHLAFFKPTEEACFNTLLPLLTPAALSKMTPILRVPGRQPYTRAKAALLKHFAKTPRDLARELRELRSLGDNTPTEILAHIRGLLPDPDVLFEVVLLDLLPANARDAALQHTSLDAMAEAADLIVAENAVAASAPAVSSLTLSSPPASPSPSASDTIAAVAAAPSPSTDLCPVHARYGKAAYRCSSPSTCRMKNIIRQRPAARPSPASGNSRAGGRS